MDVANYSILSRNLENERQLAPTESKEFKHWQSQVAWKNCSSPRPNTLLQCSQANIINAQKGEIETNK